MRKRLKYFSLLLLLSGGIITTAVFAAAANPAIATDASPPPDAPRDLKRLIGEYRSPDEKLTIYEAGGQLRADGLGLHQAALRQITATRFSAEATPMPKTALQFELDRDGQPVSVTVGASQLQFKDIGQDVVAQIRAGVNSNSGQLRATALAAKPPAEAAAKRPFDLVDLATIDPTIKFDIRYAGSNNFIGFPLYERAAAFLQRPAAEALGRVERSLAAKGYGLLIHDAYRPWFVTKMFWDATPESDHMFVADPAEGSRHNRGCAVDLTLYDLTSGNAVEMTGRYDEMSPRSYADYLGGTSRQRWLRELLRNAMQAQGFAVYPEEWWHFDYKDWRDYAIGTATFTQLLK
ncbi:MAG TPA: M15 family metallopeptidase [Steroidobacteraceae bacterium]